MDRGARLVLRRASGRACRAGLGIECETLRKHVRQVEADRAAARLLSSQEREEIKSCVVRVRAAPRERDPEVRQRVFRGRARPTPSEVSRSSTRIVSRFGVESICRDLGVSASAYYRRAGRPALGPLDRGRAVARGDRRAARGQLLRLRVPADVEGAAARRRAGRALPCAAADARTTAIQGAKRRGKPWRTTTSDPGGAARPDLVNRDFTASRPNELWVADFERHEALMDRAVMKGHRLWLVAASRVKLRAA